MTAWQTRQHDWIGRLDSAVSEVFEMMLERNCSPAEIAEAIAPSISARILFSGAIHGECVLLASSAVAQVTAEALLGTPSDPDDPASADAIGELCNMIAGGWKSKLGSEEARCTISPPTVSAHSEGLDPKTEVGFLRFYRFEDHVFGVQMNF
ncbi:chemotaxis protein CheX [Edaphobacter sp. HDX4]|uniref:chemotaxis protein CheX n=1 Tax=Edaphobacter sp. HDX4 TaxID=2794064 RepID=UPI002FE5C27A